MRTSNHSDHQQPTATIYQFPVGGRAALNRRPGEINPADFSYPAVDFGSGWYHDEAIQQEKRQVEH